MKKIVVATKNVGKVREMTAAFSDLPVKLVLLSEFGAMPEPEETGTTFAENAEIKARFYMERTGCASLADDSGLCAEALGGAPGVYSARFAGYHADDASNNEKLLAELSRAGVSESAAAYRCELAFCDVDGTILRAGGECAGVIRMAARGTGGFGYDPYFYISENRTMAELTLPEKDAISHRGAALRAMAAELEKYFNLKINEKI